MVDKETPLKFPIEYKPIVVGETESSSTTTNHPTISPIREEEEEHDKSDIDIARNRTSLNVMDMHGRLSFLDTNR